MKSSDLEYIFDNMPSYKMNKYPLNIETNTVKQFIEYLNQTEYKFSIKDIDQGLKSIQFQREDSTPFAVLKNPIYPINSDIGRKLAINKLKTEKVLKNAGLLTTNSKLYNYSQKGVAKNNAYKENDADKGVVIKPLNLSLGKGVFVNVIEKNFFKHWDDCVNVMKKNKRKNGKILVQDFMEGFEVRANILEGKLISILARIPAYVIGNGESTIEELIDVKNKEREQCGYLRKNLIKKSEAVKTFLSNEGLSFQSIPSENEYVLLISVSNTSLGGEILEITNIVSEETRQLALNALAAFPSMYSGGIDIMIKDFDDKEPRVIEINPFPVLALSTYPTYGVPHEPFCYYVGALYTRDQLENDLPLTIPNRETFIRNYYKYFLRQQELIKENIADAINNY